MQFKTLFTASLLSGLSSAATAENKAFQLAAINSNSPVNLSPFSASHGSFSLKLPEGAQAASCDGEVTNAATFQINAAGELVLYHGTQPTQKAFTVRSAMGQGVFGYRTGPLPRNSETKGWSINADGHLEFNGVDSFIACPNRAEGAWSVWIDTGRERPGNTNVECTSVAARVIEVENPISCVYTQE
ncbi:hypothetical protein F66182_8680 [Fusarium sp. NRRL 66182]|nr:hypothetical protein F66182_8680 [Fusarium sp. NRRL 66182]